MQGESFFVSTPPATCHPAKQRGGLNVTGPGVERRTGNERLGSALAWLIVGIGSVNVTL
jgi:hypothetical protein